MRNILLIYLNNQRKNVNFLRLAFWCFSKLKVNIFEGGVKFGRISLSNPSKGGAFTFEIEGGFLVGKIR